MATQNKTQKTQKTSNLDSFLATANDAYNPKPSKVQREGQKSIASSGARPVPPGGARVGVSSHQDGWMDATGGVVSSPTAHQKQITSTGGSSVPAAPPWADIDWNIKAAQKFRQKVDKASAPDPKSPYPVASNIIANKWLIDKWFYDHVNGTRNGSNIAPWDYKEASKFHKGKPDYDDFGNFNYGATGRALGIPLPELLLGANYAHIKDGGRDTLFDQPRGQDQIKKGYQYYGEKYASSK